MSTTIQSIDSTNSTLSVGGVESMRLQPGGVVSINGGSQLAGMRNKFINGGCAVAQRSNVVLTTTSSVYGGCDRMITTISATTVSAIALQAFVAAPSSTGFAAQIGNVTTTGSTLLSWAQRIESRDCFALSGKTITVSAWVWQDTGSAVNFNFDLYRPTSTIDTWSSTTTIGSMSAVSVPTSTWTKVKGTYTLGSTDAQFGLMAVLQSASMGALTSKQFYACDFQLEQGAVMTTFEVRPYALELLLCQRFCHVIFPVTVNAPLVQGNFWTTGDVYCPLSLPVRMRTIPSPAFSTAGDFTILAAGSTFAASAAGGGTSSLDMIELVFTVSGGTAGRACWVRATNANTKITISAEL